MSSPQRPYRSVLYIPASNERALAKAATLPVDAIIFDLEDAVSPDAKEAGRSLLAETLAQADYGGRYRIVRINGFDTEWGQDDLSAIAGASPDAILLPKVGKAEDITGLDQRMTALPGLSGATIWAMMETPGGVLNAAGIARAPRMEGFVMGTNDLAKELGTRFRADRLGLMQSLQTCLLAARDAGIVCVDGVFNAFRDEEGLRDECIQGRDLGFDGKTLIHPAQVAIANAEFAPTEEEITLAHRQIEAHEAALAEGSGVAVVDGRIVENLHVETARATIARAEAIQKLED